MESLHGGRQPDARTRDNSAFINELRQFHQNRNTLFRHAPRINGREVDLLTLYNQVTAQGGWHKVNEGHKWDIVLEALGFPTACANANLAIRQIYTRYLGAYEKIHFLGEDPDHDEDHTTETRSSRKQQHNYLQQVPMAYNHGQHELSDFQRTAVGMSQDFVYPKDYDKIRLSLMSGLPNEQDFALNIFTLLSNEGKHVLHLERMPKLVDLLIAQTGIWTESDPSLKSFFLESWKDIEGRDMQEFWEQTLDIADADVCELFLGKDAIGNDLEEDSQLFNLKHSIGSRNAEGQRVLRIALILYNLSFESHNVPILSKNSTCLRFVLLCIYSRWSYLRQVGLDTLSNLAGQIKLSLKEADLKSRLIMRTMTEGIESSDRFVILRSLEILANLVQFDENDEILACSVDIKMYERILALLTIDDVMLLVYSLEALFALSELGKRVCDKIMRVHKAVGTLVTLLTIDPQSSTPIEGKYKLVETFETITTTTTTTTTTVLPPHTPAPPAPTLAPPGTPISSLPPSSVPSVTLNSVNNPMGSPAAAAAGSTTTTTAAATTPLTQRLNLHHHQIKQQLNNSSSTTTTSSSSSSSTHHVLGKQMQHQETPPICGPTEIPLKRTAATPSQIHGPEMDSESVACSWLKSFYELRPGDSVARNELYADYVSYCSGVGRKCVVNANVFSNCLRSVFPQSGLKRFESANGNVTLQHDCLRRRDFPIQIKASPLQVSSSSSSSSPSNNAPASSSGAISRTFSSPNSPSTLCSSSSSQTVSSIKPQQSHSPILKAHLSSPLRSLTPPPLIGGVATQSPPSSPGGPVSGNNNATTLAGGGGGQQGGQLQGGSGGNTNLIKSLLASKVSRNIQKQQQQQQQQQQSSPLGVVSMEQESVLTLTPKTGKNKNVGAKGRIKNVLGSALQPIRINGLQMDCLQIDVDEAKLSINHRKTSVIQNHINNEESDSSSSLDKDLIQTVLMATNNSNNAPASGGGHNNQQQQQQQNGLPNSGTIIKSEIGTQFLIPVTSSEGGGGGGELLLRHQQQQQTTIPRVIVISNNNSKGNSLRAAGIEMSTTTGVNTLLVPSPFTSSSSAAAGAEASNQESINDSKDNNQLLKTVLANITMSDCKNSDEDLKRIKFINDKDRLYKTSPLLNGLLDKGKIPLPGETGSSKEMSTNTVGGGGDQRLDFKSVKIEEDSKCEPRSVVVKEDILSTAMAFAELDDEEEEEQQTDPSTINLNQNNISQDDQMGAGTVPMEIGSSPVVDFQLDANTILSGGTATLLATRGVSATDLSSISDIARTLECASKAISRTNAECQLPFMSVPSCTVTNASGTSMPATHIVSVVRINPQATAITLPMMTSTGVAGMGQQIVQAHILRLQAPGMSIKMDDRQELIRLPQLTAAQLAQLQSTGGLSVSASGVGGTVVGGDNNATATLLGSTLMTSQGTAMTLKRPSNNAQGGTACFLLETKRARQDLGNQTTTTTIGTGNAALLGGMATKTPLLEASLRQSGITVISGGAHSCSSSSGGGTTTTQLVTVPAIMSADGQVKQQAQTFHLQLPKLQPKQTLDSNYSIAAAATTTSGGGGGLSGGLVGVGGGALRTVSLVTTTTSGNSISFPSVTVVRHTPLQQTINVTAAIKSTTVSTISASTISNAVTATTTTTTPVLKTQAIAIRPANIPQTPKTILSKALLTSGAVQSSNSGKLTAPKVEQVKGQAATTTGPAAKEIKPTPATPLKLKYICQWKNCSRSFSTATSVLFHVSKAHTPPENETEAICQWENCDTMKRKKLSLLTHLQDRHCNEQLLQLQAIRRHQVAQFGKSSIPPNQPPPPHPGYAPDAALLAIRRHALQYINPMEFQEEKEGPLTKSIRLTASLVLRNLVVYCPSACSSLRQHESDLSCMAMSKVESSRTIAQCLLELARPTTSGGGGGTLAAGHSLHSLRDNDDDNTSFVPGLKESF